MTSTYTGQWPTKTQQHSQFDIYPQKLVQTDIKLKSVQEKLSVMINNIAQKRKQIQQNLSKNNKQHINNNIEVCTHENNNQGTANLNGNNNQQISANVTKSNEKDTVKQQDNIGMANKPQLYNSQILQLIQRWAKQDHIDLITKQQMEKTVAFYESRLAQSQARYNQMKQHYAQMQEQNKKQVNLMKKISHRKNSSFKEEDHPKQDGNDQKEQSTQNQQNVKQGQNQNIKQTNKLESKESGNEQHSHPIQTTQQLKQFQQIIKLQDKIKQLSEQNKSLLQKLSNLPNLQQQLTSLKQKIQQKSLQIQKLNTNLNQVNQKLLDQDVKYKQIQANLTTTQQKLQTKQKQLLKYIHCQSSFAAQQLTNLQTALMSQKQEGQKQKLEYETKIKGLQQQVRQLTFNCENQKQENEKLKNENKFLTQIKQQNQVKQPQDNHQNQTGSQNNVQITHHTMTQPQENARNVQQIPHVPAFITTKSSILEERGKVSQETNKDNTNQPLKQQLGSAKNVQALAVAQQAKKQQNKSNPELSKQNQEDGQKSNLKPQEVKRKQSCSYESAASTLKRSRYRLSIEHTVGLEQYYLKAKQVDKQKYPANQNSKLSDKQQSNGKQQRSNNKIARSMSPGRHHHKKQENIQDILFDENEGNLSGDQNNIDVDNIFTKVISVKQHTQHLSQSSRSNVKNQNGQQPHINMQIASQILLVPSSSINQITNALWTLHQKLRDVQAVVKENNLQYGVKPEKRKWSQDTDTRSKEKLIQKQKSINKQAQNQKQKQKQTPQNVTSIKKIIDQTPQPLNTTTFPGQQQLKKKQQQNKQSMQNLSPKQKQKAIRQMSPQSIDIDLEGLNKQIYYSTREVYELCQALMSNFEDQIINRQTEEVREQFKNKGVNKNIQIKKNEEQKPQVKNQEKKQYGSKQQINIDKKEDHHINQPSKLTLQIPQTLDGDTQSGFKLINNELKSVFQTFFNDSKLFHFQQEQPSQSAQFQAQHARIKQQNILTPEEIKNQDEKSILQILKKLTMLHEQLSRKRQQISKKNKQKVQRLFDVIRSMIINFKISYKAINNIIVAKQIGSSANKYMHLRLYLNSLYKVLQQERDILHGPNISGAVSAPSGSSGTIPQPANPTQSETSTPVFTMYDNYEDKLDKLSNQLSKIRLQLDHKNQDFENLKQLASTYIDIKKEQNQKEQNGEQKIKQENSAKLNNQNEVKDQGNHLQQSDINKVQVVNGNGQNQTNINGNPESQPQNLQMLKSQLAQYKKKCEHYQSKYGENGRKKQRIIYIRK